MKINEIKYSRRFNMGNYEHEEISVGVAVEQHEDANEILAQVKVFVSSRGLTAITSVNEPSVNTGAMEAAAAESMAAAPAPEAAPVAKPVRAKKAKTEVAAEAPAVEAAPAVVEKPALSVVKPEQEPASEAKPKFRTKSVTKYSRANELHKKLLVEYLDGKYPTWKKELAVQAKNASAKADNIDFLDGEGLILPAFKQIFDAEMVKR